MTLSGAETVQERPLLSRKSKARLSDCGVIHEVCIDHRGRLPGFSTLTVDVNWFRLTPQRLSGCRVGGLELNNVYTLHAVYVTSECSGGQTVQTN